MNCRQASMASVERDLTGLPSEVETALDAHLSGCPGCAERVRDDRILLEDLAALRRTAPLGVDVRERVAAVLRNAPPPVSHDVSPWHLGWAAAAALAGAAALLPALGWSVRAAAPLLRDLRAAAGGLWAAADTLATPLIAAAAIPVEWVLGLIGPAGPLWAIARGIEPAAVGATAVLYAMMAAAITIIVGRDLRRPVPHWDQKEH